MLAAGPFGLGPLELGLIVLVLILLFGATRLADVGGSLGKGIKEFRKNVKDEATDDDTATTMHSTPTAGAATTVAAANGNGDVVSAAKCPSCGSLNAVSA